MRPIVFLLCFFSLACGHSQNATSLSPHLVGGPCEGCEAILEYGTRTLTASDTLADFYEPGEKIIVSGTVSHPDGTPAKDVIIYVYHTNQNGIYKANEGAKGWEQRHGSIRGWMKTGDDGRYSFYTLKPGIYPDRSSPAHVHVTILEPDGKYYWLESYHFAGDPLLTGKETAPEHPRGGSSGLLVLKNQGNIAVATRDIVLGKNVYDEK